MCCDSWTWLECCVKRRCIRTAKNEVDIDNAISQLQDKCGKQLYSYHRKAMDSYTYMHICSFLWSHLNDKVSDEEFVQVRDSFSMTKWA